MTLNRRVRPNYNRRQLNKQHTCELLIAIMNTFNEGLAPHIQCGRGNAYMQMWKLHSNCPNTFVCKYGLSKRRHADNANSWPCCAILNNNIWLVVHQDNVDPELLVALLHAVILTVYNVIHKLFLLHSVAENQSVALKHKSPMSWCPWCQISFENKSTHTQP